MIDISSLVHMSETFAAATIRLAVPLALAGIGESYAERSGILNIGLEGIMLMGAFFSFLAAYMTQSIVIGIGAGVIAGMTMSLIHAVLSIECRANQTMTGLALNFIASGLTSYVFLIFFGRTTNLPECPMVSSIQIPLLSDIPIIGSILFEQDLFVYTTMILVAVTWILFYRTTWGMVMHAVGEHPKAAASAGISVRGVRYGAALSNGLFGGLAGAYLTLGLLGFFMENITSGKGYIALVVVILGRRNPLGVLAAALLIGSADALQFRVQTLGIGIPSQVFIMFPYVITVIVLLFSIGKTREPAALGQPFIRSRR